MESIGNLNKIGSKWGQNLQASNLLVINYAMDEKSQVFSHQIELVNQLSAKFDQITVLTAQVGVCNTEKNVKVISFDWVEGKRVSSLLRFLKIFIKTIRSEKFTVLFSHMTSVQSAFISPITRIIRLKHYLWFAHTSNGIFLKVSRLLTNGIITSTPGSCPLKGSKVFPIGQSINSQKFKKKNSNTQSVKNLVHIGRFDPSKNVRASTPDQATHAKRCFVIRCVKNILYSQNILVIKHFEKLIENVNGSNLQINKPRAFIGPKIY